MSTNTRQRYGIITILEGLRILFSTKPEDSLINDISPQTIEQAAKNTKMPKGDMDKLTKELKASINRIGKIEQKHTSGNEDKENKNTDNKLNNVKIKPKEGKTGTQNVDEANGNSTKHVEKEETRELR